MDKELKVTIKKQQDNIDILASRYKGVCKEKKRLLKGTDDFKLLNAVLALKSKLKKELHEANMDFRNYNSIMKWRKEKEEERIKILKKIRAEEKKAQEAKKVMPVFIILSGAVIALLIWL